jgi:hypothetical protein
VCAVCCVLCAVCCVLCAVCCELCVVCSVLCVACCVLASTDTQVYAITHTHAWACTDTHIPVYPRRLAHLGKVMLMKILIVVSFRSNAECEPSRRAAFGARRTKRASPRSDQRHVCKRHRLRELYGSAPSTNSSCFVVLVTNVASSEQKSTVMHSMLIIETARRKRGLGGLPT